MCDRGCFSQMVTFFKLGPNCVTSQILKDLPHFSLFVHITRKVFITTLSNYISEERLQCVNIHYAHFGRIFRVTQKLYRV